MQAAIPQNDFALWLPLVIALGITLCTIAVHATAGLSTIGFIQWRFAHGHAGVSVRGDLPLMMASVSIFMVAHLVEMAIWAVALLAIGEFHTFASAFYHSAVNYTTLGYGDIVMTPRWRLLGPLEGADGMLMFGLSTAVLFTAVFRLIQLRSRGHETWLGSEPPTSE